MYSICSRALLGSSLSLLASACSASPPPTQAKPLAPVHFASTVDPESSEPKISLENVCVEELKVVPGKFKSADLISACAKVSQLPGCASEAGRPIYHYEKEAKDPKAGQRILALSLIHGDEGPSGNVTRAWMIRLLELESRNTWRVIPVVNPDGWKSKTRTNGRRVDLNRNFPTKDWEATALEQWTKSHRKDPRRYPGPSAASEPETKCVMKHIADFKPDFIVSIHTPLGVLDFDGPQTQAPRFDPLPWLSLGNYPGSLGRYMWGDNSVPVLTIELKGNRALERLEHMDRLQDLSGTVALEARKRIKPREDDLDD